MIITLSGRLAEIRWSVVSQNLRGVRASHSPGQILDYAYIICSNGQISIYYYHLLLQGFSHQCQQMVFHWRLSDSKSPEASRTLLSSLAVLNNAVVWKVSTRPPTSKSSSLFNNPLFTVPKAPITIGIIVTFMFHTFFQFSSKVEVLILLFTFFQFYSVVSQPGQQNRQFCIFSFFCWWSSGRN